MTFTFLYGCSPAIPPVTGESLSPPDLSAPTELLTKPELNNSLQPEDGDETQSAVFIGLSAHYIDVGQGDSILICFPDGKTMMIDCGKGSFNSVNMISSALKIKKVTSLDYLVLTHPDYDHVGGVKEALKDIEVKKVFHPEISEEKPNLDDYFSVLQFLKDKGAETEVSAKGICFGEDYKVAFLSQTPRKRGEGAYRDFHMALEPTESQINNLSPYIYLEYKGYRFMFTGDAGMEEENKLINDYSAGLLKKSFSNKGLEPRLEDIDFLKVAHHGSNDANSQDFLNLLKPKHAIISVGGQNILGHPTTTTLLKLQTANPEHELLRTDHDGTVSVFISSDGQMAIKTQKGE